MTNYSNITVDRNLTETGNWQVIFKTPQREEYCRETIPGDASLYILKAWVAEKIKWIPHVDRARIEKW